MSDRKHRARLFDDNPASVDLLGFDAVVAPVIEILESRGLDPIAVGVHAPWGGGKSTVLGLLKTRLADAPGYIVVRINPWEFEDSADVKSALIDAVLAELSVRLSDESSRFENAANRISDLVRRVSWARAGQVLLRSAVTMTPDLLALVEALTPTEKRPLTLAGFREEFARFLAELEDLQRVVVLVDDLDRCLPPAVVKSLEAIKLFLSVPKMAFVLAADQDAVRDAISHHLAGGQGTEAAARHYLDKIIQIPILLPRIPTQDAEAYVALLLAAHDLDDEQMGALRFHCGERRLKGEAPLDGAGDLGLPDEAAQVGAQIVHGLGPDRAGNPRDIKRFLNVFGVRRSIAAARLVEIETPLLVKLLLLEDRHRTAFTHLVSLGRADQADLIERWEEWASDNSIEQPHKDLDGTQEWAGRDPSLRSVELSSYLTLAAALVGRASGVALPTELLEIVNDLVSSTSSIRDAARARAVSIAAPDRQRVAEELGERLRRADDPSASGRALGWLASDDDGLVPTVLEALRRIPGRAVTPVMVAALAKADQITGYLIGLADDGDLTDQAKTALDELKQGSDGHVR